MWDAVDNLPGKQRSVFLLRFVEEMELPEIATAMGLHVGTVKSHLHRAPCCGAQGNGENEMNTNHLSPWEQEEYVLDQRTPEMLRHLRNVPNAGLRWLGWSMAWRFPQRRRGMELRVSGGPAAAVYTSAARGFPVLALRWALPPCSPSCCC